MNRQTIEKGNAILEKIQNIEFQIEQSKSNLAKAPTAVTGIGMKINDSYRRHQENVILIYQDELTEWENELKALKDSDCSDIKNCCNTQSVDLKEFIDNSVVNEAK